MSTVVEITIPGEPRPKLRARFAVRPINGRPTPVPYTPTKTRDYENLVKMAAHEAMAGEAPFDEALVASVVVYLPIPESWSKKKKRMAELGEVAPASRPDLDNFVKAAIDGCNKIVFIDDSRIAKMFAEKRYSLRPRLEIRIEAFKAAGALL